ncbi:MAG: hypothetical protein ABI852_06860 [Gemmatimonadaceae bacterium]
MGFFDWRLGSSLDYALKNGGKVTEAAPFEGRVSSTASAFAFSAPRPDSVELSLALPALTRNGFFQLILHPKDAPSGNGQAIYQLFEGVPPSGNGPKLVFNYTAEPMEKGWRLKITLLVPPD